MPAPLSASLGAARVFECDVTRDEDLVKLSETLASEEHLDAVVHSIAFANQADLTRPFVETSREGYLLAQNISAYSMIAVARATGFELTGTIDAEGTELDVWRHRRDGTGS